MPGDPARQSTGLFERVLVWGVLATLLWAPIPLGSNRLWAGGALILIIAVLFSGWGVLLLWKGWSTAQTRSLRLGLPLMALLLCAQIWVALQMELGYTLHPGASTYSLMLGIAYCMLFMLVIGLFWTRRRLTLLLGCLVVSGMLQGFYASLSTLTGFDWVVSGDGSPYSGFATGTYINRNHLAGYLELTLAAGIGLLLALRGDGPLSWKAVFELLLGPKARIRVALIIMVIALVMTASRGGNAAFFISLMIVGLWFVVRFRENRMRNLIILASIVVIDLVIISHYFGLERLRDRLAATEFTFLFEAGSEPVQPGDWSTAAPRDPGAQAPSEVRSSEAEASGEQAASPNTGMFTLSSEGGWRLTLDVNDARSLIFRNVVPLVSADPWYGNGAGAFETVFLSRADPGFGFRLDHAHNDYLQFLVEFGLIGTLPLALFVLVCLVLALRALSHPYSKYRSGVGFGAAMGLLALLIHAWSDFNLQIPANAATFVVLCAIAVLANTHTSPRRRSGN